MKNRIRELRKSRQMTMKQLGEVIGVAESTISQYETGRRQPDNETLLQLGAFFDVPVGYLLCAEHEKAPIPEDERKLPPNVIVLPPMNKIPLVGQIACGTPILAEENITDYVDLPSHIRADYALTCKGDSMINAGIRDGDIVYIRQQEEVENGGIAAVMVDGEEATLKRFYFDGEMVQLVAENPKVMPMVFTGENANRVRVLGLAVAYTHVIG